MGRSREVKAGDPPPKNPRSQGQKGGQTPHAWQIQSFVASSTQEYADWGTFHDFILKATIPPFDASKLPTPYEKLYYNDDLFIEAFRKSAKHFAGKQRRGVVDEHWESLAM